MQDGLNSARWFARGTNRIREGNSSSLLLRVQQKCSGKATKPGAEQAWTGWETPDVRGGLRRCPVVKLCWSCPSRKQAYGGTECMLLVQALRDLQVWTG